MSHVTIELSRQVDSCGCSERVGTCRISGDGRCRSRRYGQDTCDSLANTETLDLSRGSLPQMGRPT